MTRPRIPTSEIAFTHPHPAGTRTTTTIVWHPDHQHAPHVSGDPLPDGFEATTPAATFGALLMRPGVQIIHLSPDLDAVLEQLIMDEGAL